MGPPVMLFYHEAPPPGRVVRFTGDGGPQNYLVPDDGRDIEDLPLSEFRPYPALDAIEFLSRATGIPVPVMLTDGGCP